MIDKNKVTADEQLQRMKALMSYGINEAKQPVYSSVEYNKVAADGKLYGIVREGTKYFIKVAKMPRVDLLVRTLIILVASVIEKTTSSIALHLHNVISVKNDEH